MTGRQSLCELRNQRDTSKPINLVWLWFRSPHDKAPTRMMRTSEPPHERCLADARGSIKAHRALLVVGGANCGGGAWRLPRGHGGRCLPLGVARATFVVAIGQPAKRQTCKISERPDGEQNPRIRNQQRNG